MARSMCGHLLYAETLVWPSLGAPATKPRHELGNTRSVEQSAHILFVFRTHHFNDTEHSSRQSVGYTHKIK
jgi:hypothetical protein